MMADTDEKINECVEKSLNYLSAIGRPIVLKCEQRISIQHLFIGKDVIHSNFAYWIWKKHDIYHVCFGEGFVGVVLLAMTEKYKTIIKLTSFPHCKPAKSIINNSYSDWFSKANTLVWAEPCAWWAELKMLSFWAGGISSFPPCAREYRLLCTLTLVTVCFLVYFCKCF